MSSLRGKKRSWGRCLPLRRFLASPRRLVYIGLEETTMRDLTIADLKLALRDLLGPNQAELRRSQTGQMYETRLRAKQKGLDARVVCVADLRHL
jgi:hypothetical protein